VVRPLAYCREADIARYAHARQFPIIPCNLCGSQPNAQRQQIKAMLRAWEAEDPRRIASIFTALQQVAPSHLLDRRLFDFEALSEKVPTVEDTSCDQRPAHKDFLS